MEEKDDFIDLDFGEGVDKAEVQPAEPKRSRGRPTGTVKKQPVEEDDEEKPEVIFDGEEEDDIFTEPKPPKAKPVAPAAAKQTAAAPAQVTEEEAAAQNLARIINDIVARLTAIESYLFRRV